jgi:flagellar hook protein FlgE
MSLSGALTAAITGLDAQSAALGAISDNVSNSQTVGYKRVETSFSTLLTVSNALVHEPGGVKSRPIHTNDIQGAIQSTETVTNLAISGDGYFAVGKVVGTSAIGRTPVFAPDPLYTRAGDFDIDNNGYLVNKAGYYLNGWALNPTTGIVQKNALVPIQVTQLKDNPQATQNVDYSANLPSTPNPKLDTVAGAGAAINDIDFPPNSFQIYDSLGAAHTINVNWTKLAGAGAEDRWTVTFTPDPADPAFTSIQPVFGGVPAAAGAPIEVDFTLSGASSGAIAGIGLYGGTGGTTGVRPAAGAANAPAQIGLQITFNSGATLTTQDVNFNLGKFGIPQQTTMFTGTDITFNSAQQDGLPPGSFRNLQIDGQGFMTINYDNGNRKTVYQIPIAKFSNYNGLQSENGNAYSTTPESGTPTLNDAGGNGTGSIIGSSLEASNVDIAAEFTKMIQTQRAYGANTRVITVTNEMFQDTDNIIR